MRLLGTHIALLSITMHITTNPSFILLALAAGAVALPVDPLIGHGLEGPPRGVASHTFSPHLFFLFCHTGLC
jgi:hypothetical protein